MNTERLISYQRIFWLLFVSMYLIGLKGILSIPDKPYLFLHFTIPFIFITFVISFLFKTLSEEREYRKEEIDHKEERISIYKKHIDNMRNHLQKNKELIQSHNKLLKEIIERLRSLHSEKNVSRKIDL